MKKFFVVEPVGGLCNRMNVIKFAYLFSKNYNYRLIVLWNNNHDLRCDFNDIFLKSDYDVISLKWPEKRIKEHIEAREWLKIVYSLFFWGTYKILHRFLKKRECVINSRREGQSVTNYIEESEKKILSQKGYIVYYSRHNNPNVERNYSMLQFRPEYYSQVDKLFGETNERIVGVHIRKTDHKICIERHANGVFEKKMEKELEDFPDTKFYIATDDGDELSKLNCLFPDRIICNESCRRERTSKGGVQDAIIDLIALSKTEKVFGSNGSTFSYVAAFMSGISVEFYYPEKCEWRNFDFG